MSSMQLDIFDLLPDKSDLPATSLFVSPSRGIRARWADYDKWCDGHGNFGSIPRSHAWLPEITLYASSSEVGQLPARCTPYLLGADLRGICGHHGRCYCVGNHVFRGACLGCTWEGPIVQDAADAVADAHDHAWPGWRDLPIVGRRPESGTTKKQLAATQAWEDGVNRIYPSGWLHAGGPIITARTGYGTRDVPNCTGHGGYDLCARDFHHRAGGMQK